MRSRHAIVALVIVLVSTAATAASASRTFRLKSTDGLELRNLEGEATVHAGRAAIRLSETKPAGGDNYSIAILPDTELQDGVIEVELAGRPRAGANDAARGFVGVAFRVAPDGSRFECFYLRPTNGRANDQLRRNHSTQYISHPGYPWHLLRRENPGVYESYVDLVPGEWTRVRIEVSGVQARLYVNGASQPALIVNDLKLGATSGRIALWVGEGTEAWFSKVVVTATGR